MDMNRVYITEGDALDAFDNGDEQTCFDIYMQLIEAIEYDDLDDDGNVSLELVSCYCNYPSFKDYRGKLKFRTRVEDFFTEEHRKELKDAIEDVLESIYEGEWVAWDMRTYPNSYMPD